MALWRYVFKLISGVRYSVEHEKRNSTSPSNHVLFCILYKHLTSRKKLSYSMLPSIRELVVDLKHTKNYCNV